MSCCSCSQFTPAIAINISNDHEWDALISCWATFNGLAGNWKTDLMPGVGNLLLPQAGSVNYFWP